MDYLKRVNLTLAYFLFSSFALILLIANPGYYSHDEFQKLDHVIRYGFADYLKSYVTIHSGLEFGTPIRPVAFFVQGVLALFMEKEPVFVHALAVASHVLNGYLLHIVLVRFQFKKEHALAIAFLFVVLPTSIIATGWSAALMDRLFIFFGLSAFLFAESFIQKKGNYYIVLVLIFSALAMLSKETAIVLPASLLILLIKQPNSFFNSRYWIAGITWSTPVLVFLIYRLTAISNSFSENNTGAYHASFSNVLDGLVVYSAYPFLTHLTEAINWVFLSKLEISIAIVAHLSILTLLCVKFGKKWGLFYCCGYFLFLIPVLMIPIKAAHYLYASGMFLSIAVISLWVHSNLIIRSYLFLLISILMIHSFILQGFVYRVGTCMSTLNTTAISSYLSMNKPSRMLFKADQGAAEHMLHRLITGREQLGDFYPISMEIINSETAINNSEPIFHMTPSCLIYTGTTTKND